MASHSNTQRHGVLPHRSEPDHFFREHGWTRTPHLVQWMVTLQCPLSCGHCLAAANRTPRDMPLSAAAGMIEEIAELGVHELLLTGGEPLARQDLTEVIGMLRSNRVPWTLNTALMPDARTRRAIETWPPRFVAVSLDGPEPFHDAFRGSAGTFLAAMESIRYFCDVTQGTVAAGTTVTAKNFRHLPATFKVVIESGASSWGLHLPVPEGRAAPRKDLFLSTEQLKALLRFAAVKRQHFPRQRAEDQTAFPLSHRLAVAGCHGMVP